MNLPDLFQSLAGRYVTQSFLHAFIAVIIADGALRAWKIEDPAVKQRYRVLTVLFPVFSFPLFQAINPGRGSLFFRADALFDSGRWLALELFGTIPFSVFFLLLLGGTSLVFFFQELLPILRHARESGNGIEETDDPAMRERLDEALHSLPLARPKTVIIDDDEMVLFSSTGRTAMVFVSSGLLQALDGEQVRAALAHEIAHIIRSRRPVLLAAFLLRMLLFFNPLVLVEFRRAVRNEEKICDDMAVAATGRPDALAATLKKFYSRPGQPPGPAKELRATAVPLQEYSHDLQLRSRIERLKNAPRRQSDGGWPLLIVALLVITGICYFVV